jgi:hypothetical protein
MTTLLIDFDYVIQRSFLESNVGSEMVNKAIYQAQRIYILELLGTNLYNTILDKTETNTIGGYYKDLLDNYIAPTLCLWTQFVILPLINYKFTNKAISKKTSDFSDYADLNELKFLLNRIESYAQFEAERMREYIINNQSEFPEYLTQTGIKAVGPNNDTYTSGLWID